MALLVLIAYLFTGTANIIWDFGLPYIDRPAYARRPERFLSGFAMMVLGWAPLQIYQATLSKMWGRAVKSLLTFAILVIAGDFVL